MVDNIAFTPAPSRKTVKQNARRLLSNQDIRLKLVFGSLICASVFVMLEYILSYALLEPIYYFMPELSTWTRFGIDQAYFAIEFLLFSPLIIGFYSLSAGLAGGGTPELSQIFCCYRSFRRMCRAWAISLISFLPIKLYFVLTDIVSALELTKPLLILLAVVFFIALLVGGLFLYGRLYTFINAAICGVDRPLSRCLFEAVRSTRGHLAEIFTFRLSFLLWVLLSVATIGVLFIIFTIPYMAISYSHYSSYLITGEYRIPDSEDFYNE